MARQHDNRSRTCPVRLLGGRSWTHRHALL